MEMPNNQVTHSPSVFTIAADAPFLDTLARHVLAGRFTSDHDCSADPLALSRHTILLPTRRACRAMTEAFLKISDGNALLLPHIRPISETDENGGLLFGLTSPNPHSQIWGVPSSVSELERRLVLTQLVIKWSETSDTALRDHQTPKQSAAPVRSPAQAAHLAAELARLIDRIETEGVDLSRIVELVPEAFSAHWQLTLEFLKIITKIWPQYLADRGLISPAEHRNRLLAAEAERLLQAPSSDPYIVAGVTGSVPATADLMKVVATRPTGSVVLDGLDQFLDQYTWQTLARGHPEHPQHGLANLLGDLRIDRSSVTELTAHDPAPARTARLNLVSEAMRPAPSTHSWHTIQNSMDQREIICSLQDVHLVEARTGEEEAAAISLILRGAVEQSNKTAALVTPDRNLARRVVIKLEEWGLRIDDSAGRPLQKTVLGSFLDLILEAQLKAFAPSTLMALLKHPMARLGLDPAAARAAARALELLAFRQPYLGFGMKGVVEAVARAKDLRSTDAHRHGAIRRLSDVDLTNVDELLTTIVAAFSLLTSLTEQSDQTKLSKLVRAHVAVAEVLARDTEGHADHLWAGDAGEVACLFLTGLMDDGIPQPSLHAHEYADIYRSLVSEQVVRPSQSAHPRISIWGPYEARLQQADCIVLGGLNEGSWPRTVDADPWLNRPMCAELGLPLPEQHIGFAAHDFSLLFGAPEIYLTRSSKLDGTPTVRSRWLLRLDAVLKALDIEHGLSTLEDPRWLHWARSRDGLAEAKTIAQPEPRPPVASRPRRLSVTDVERWIANPYAIFARHILRLEPLARLGAEPDAALRGMLIHQALHRFAVEHSTKLPANMTSVLVQIADSILEDYRAHPRIAAFWHPRFARFAEWFAETEPSRRHGVQQIKSEIKGCCVFDGPAGPFELTARADRIDLLSEGTLAIYDYKTGGFASDKQVTSGHAPQLPLEAAIALLDGFAGIENRTVSSLAFISASGGEPPGREHTVKIGDSVKLAEDAFDGLRRLVALFDHVETPYRAMRRTNFEHAYRMDDYAHLARVEEWSAGTGGGDG